MATEYELKVPYIIEESNGSALSRATHISCAQVWHVITQFACHQHV